MPCNKASRKMIKVLNDTKNLGSRRFIASEMQDIDIDERQLEFPSNDN